MTDEVERCHPELQCLAFVNLEVLVQTKVRVEERVSGCSGGPLAPVDTGAIASTPASTITVSLGVPTCNWTFGSDRFSALAKVIPLCSQALNPDVIITSQGVFRKP
jgi:hypothetical protein